MKFLLDRHSLIASTLGLVVLAGSTSLLLAGPLSPPRRVGNAILQDAE